MVFYTIPKKLVVYLTIKGIKKKLPADRFLQVHKSHIVNLKMINSIEGNMLNLGSAKITVGQSFYDEVMDRILKGKYFKR